MADKLEVQQGTGWVNELNRDPRFRTPAGAGTEVIQKEQEKFMQQAWAQLGDLLQANQRIRQLQLAWMSTFVTYQKNVLPQPTDQFLTFTHAVQARVLGSPTTIARQVKDSRLPRAALDPAFRKIARSRGAIMRKVVPDGTAPPRAVLSQLNEGKLSAAPPPPDPTGQISLDAVAESIVPASLPEWLRVLLRSGLLTTVLVAAMVVTLVLMIIAGAFLLLGLVLGVILVGLAALLFGARRLRSVVETSEAFRESAFKPDAVERIPPRPNFVLTEFDAPLPASPVRAARTALKPRTSASRSKTPSTSTSRLRPHSRFRSRCS